MEHPDDDICRRFLANPTINPRTGRTIKQNKDVYKNLIKLCKERNFDVSSLTQTNKNIIINKNIINKKLLPAPKAPNKTLTSTKVWVPKQTSIIDNKNPDDLLQLYLSNITIEKSLDNEKIIQELNKKYKTTIETSSFIEWYKYYNYVNVAKNVKYLYMLEKEQFIDPDYLDRLNAENITQSMIAILFDWTKEVIKMFKLTNLVYCYTCTLFYIIFSNNQSKINKQNLQMYGLISLYYSAIILDYNPIDLDDLAYISDKAFSVEQLNNTAIEVFNDLSGKLIYPSPIFFVDQKNNDLKSLVAFATSLPELSIYKPSLIAHTCTYMLTGKYTIYSVEEMSNICAKIQLRLKKSLESSLTSFKNAAVNLINKINLICKENKLIIDIIAKYNYSEPWHLGEFEELEEIGRGGYGEITKIKLKTCNKEYVTKISTGEDDNSFLREIALLKLLSNQPNIISICGFVYNMDQIKIILPLMKGSVYDLVNKNLLDKSKYDKYFNQILLGVFQCHDHDLIHRDLKPQNILYDQSSDSMKIIDFGISVAYQSFKNITDTDFANTINHRPPECFLFEYEKYGLAVDIWALGTIFYFMVTSRNFLDVYDFDNDITILEKIFSKLGSPTEKSYPRAAAKLERLGIKHYDFDTNLIKELGEFSGLILSCLTVNPENRPIVEELLID
jgi:hypothetical protein